MKKMIFLYALLLLSLASYAEEHGNRGVAKIFADKEFVAYTMADMDAINEKANDCLHEFLGTIYGCECGYRYKHNILFLMIPMEESVGSEKFASLRSAENTFFVTSMAAYNTRIAPREFSTRNFRPEPGVLGAMYDIKNGTPFRDLPPLIVHTGMSGSKLIISPANSKIIDKLFADVKEIVGARKSGKKLPKLKIYVQCWWSDD